MFLSRNLRGHRRSLIPQLFGQLCNADFAFVLLPAIAATSLSDFESYAVGEKSLSSRSLRPLLAWPRCTRQSGFSPMEKATVGHVDYDLVKADFYDRDCPQRSTSYVRRACREEEGRAAGRLLHKWDCPAEERGVQESISNLDDRLSVPIRFEKEARRAMPPSAQHYADARDGGRPVYRESVAFYPNGAAGESFEAPSREDDIPICRKAHEGACADRGREAARAESVPLRRGRPDDHGQLRRTCETSQGYAKHRHAYL